MRSVEISILALRPNVDLLDYILEPQVEKSSARNSNIFLNQLKSVGVVVMRYNECGGSHKGFMSDSVTRL